ncbi:hypothetical protein ACB092_05G049200 [Castanea dentata]
MAPGKLVVENLSGDVNEDGVKELFSEAGLVDSIDFESSTRCVVKFYNSNHAREAMDKLNGTELKGKPMIITLCENPCRKAKLWVSIDGPTIDNDNFKALLSSSGAVDSFEMVSQHPDKSTWIVQFDSETSATNAIEYCNGAEINGRKFLVSKYDACKNLCVECRPKAVDENNIQSAFSLYGECTVNMEKDKNCKLTGVGIVSYTTSKGPEEAMRNLNGTKLGSVRLYVRGIVTQTVTEDNNPEEAPIIAVTEDNNTEEAQIFVIEDGREQFVATVNMKDFTSIPDFLQSLNKVWADHKHSSPLEEISLASPWPGYKVVYKHVDSKNKEVIQPFEDVEALFNEDPFEHSKLWFLGMVNRIEFYKK